MIKEQKNGERLFNCQICLFSPHELLDVFVVVLCFYRQPFDGGLQSQIPFCRFCKFKISDSAQSFVCCSQYRNSFTLRSLFLHDIWVLVSSQWVALGGNFLYVGPNGVSSRAYYYPQSTVILWAKKWGQWQVSR